MLEIDLIWPLIQLYSPVKRQLLFSSPVMWRWGGVWPLGHFTTCRFIDISFSSISNASSWISTDNISPDRHQASSACIIQTMIFVQVTCMSFSLHDRFMLQDIRSWVYNGKYHCFYHWHCFCFCCFILQCNMSHVLPFLSNQCPIIMFSLGFFRIYLHYFTAWTMTMELG